MIVHEQSDPTSWRARKQTIEISNNEAKIEVTTPENLRQANGELNPVFEIEINMSLDGREFESAVIRPVATVGPETLDKAEIIAPQNLSNTDRKPLFEWKELRYVSHYHFQLTSSNFASPENIVVDTTINGTSFQLPGQLDGDQSYRWRVRGINEIMTGPWSDAPLFFTDLATGFHYESTLPTKFSLKQNYPNPFNPVTTIQFDLPAHSFVRITMFDTIGRLVAVLLEDEIQAGYHNILYNSALVSSGLYVYRMEASPTGVSTHTGFVQTKKMTIIK